MKPSRSFIFIVLALLLSSGLTFLLQRDYDLIPYDAWVVASSITLFLLYGLDKAQSSRKKKGVPGLVLTGLALAGGYLGGWFAMFAFWHKIRHYSIWALLSLSLLIHGAIVYYFFP